MKKINVAVLMILIIFCAVKTYATEWQPVSSKVGRFHVLMPGTPTLKTTVDHTPVGKIGEDLFTLKTKDMTFTIEYSDLPGIAVFFGGRKTIYKKANEGFLKNVHGKEVSSKNFTHDGKKGLEVTYETPTRNGKVRYLLISKRLYVTQASIVKDAKGQPAIDKYLNSFKTGFENNRKIKQKDYRNRNMGHLR